MGTPCRTIRITERVAGNASLTVDPDEGRIGGVRVLGLSSANGRSYLREAVRKALPLYEGAGVNLDHPTKPGEQTPVAKRLGWLENVRQDEDGGLRADLCYLTSHPYGPTLAEIALRRPDLVGLSHNATGRARKDGPSEVIESIDEVHSVDLVSEPATVSGLHESRTNPAEQPVKKTVKDLIEALQKKRPGYARGLREQAEAGLLSADDTMMDAPADEAPLPEEPADHEQALRDGFRAAVMAALDDEAMDMASKLARIKEILKAQEQLLAGDEAVEDEESGDEVTEGEEDEKVEEDCDDGSKKESRKKPARGNLVEQRYQLKLRSLELLLEAGVSPSKTLKKALESCKTEDEVKELVEEAKQAQPAAGSKPRSAPATPTRKGDDKAPSDPKEAARWLTT